MADVTAAHRARLTAVEASLIFGAVDKHDYRSRGRPELLDWVRLLDYFTKLKGELEATGVSNTSLVSMHNEWAHESCPPQTNYSYTMTATGQGGPIQMYESVYCGWDAMKRTAPDLTAKRRHIATVTGYTEAKAEKLVAVRAAQAAYTAYTLEEHLKVVVRDGVI